MSENVNRELYEADPVLLRDKGAYWNSLPRKDRRFKHAKLTAHYWSIGLNEDAIIKIFRDMGSREVKLKEKLAWFIRVLNKPRRERLTYLLSEESYYVFGSTDSDFRMNMVREFASPLL